jgi:hypothetical protein
MFRRFIFLALIACTGAACRSTANDAHYAQLEANRQQQAAQPAAEPQSVSQLQSIARTGADRNR